jgi:allantoin racemase
MSTVAPQPGSNSKYRFILIAAFQLPPDSRFRHGAVTGPKEKMLMNYESIKHLLADVDWDLHPGAITTYGDWAVENQEEFAHSSAQRLPIVKEACESGKYNAIVLLGGGEPGFHASREIGRRHGIPVTACAHSQMVVATLLGNRFSVIDLAESHSSYYASLIVGHRYAERCASIRNLQLPHARPGLEPAMNIYSQKEQVLRGGTSDLLEMSVREAVAAIEEDGAEVIIFGCSALYWMQPFLEKRLHEMGWEVPVLEGYRCAITLAKLLVDLGQSVSGLAYPGDRPQKWRRKKLV